MTVQWSIFAQSLTKRPMKGILTGPVTILQWSFARDDQTRRETCMQIALALRDEVADLEAAGIAIIQVDEPAIREGLPLRRQDRGAYLRWAVDAFRLATSGARDETQIHTHMCYSEFSDILDAIAKWMPTCSRSRPRARNGVLGRLSAVPLSERNRSWGLRHPLSTRPALKRWSTCLSAQSACCPLGSFG